MSQDVRCIQTQPCKWNERHTASIYWWNEVLCGYQHIRMQTTSKFMYPPFTLCCFTVRWLSALCLVAYLWKISTHHPATLPSCSIYSAQVPEVWTTLCPDSARCPSPAQTDGTASTEGVYIKRFPRSETTQWFFLISQFQQLIPEMSQPRCCWAESSD